MTKIRSDIEIAQDCKMRPILEIAEKAGIPRENIELYGKYKAKVDHRLLKRLPERDGKLILVTANLWV